MPNQSVQHPAPVPTPVTITPALLKTHSITPDEYSRIEAALGRTPSLTELGIFSVMWSEHCSYKSSRVHLKRLPTKSARVVQGPGENAGIIDVGDGWACAFKIESHNHPSYIEPYQGAATGVGGILRDIFTMNARPLAVMDSLRFGPLDETEPDEALRNKNHHIVNGIVAGVAGYGNCFGVPNLGGETRFENCYSGNPLLNAFALGLVRLDEIFYAKATGVGNPVIYVGAKTGRDGIHGATMASEEFTEGSEQKRPNVQMGDPFMEKLLLEACIEAMATGAVLGIQDMGAAGLTCSTCEMGARGDLGLTVELDLVPQRETGMSSYEIMLSESQERMLLVADKARAQEVLDVFAKWGLDASIVGTVTEKPNMVITQHGELVADIPNKSLTDDAPLYHRPVGIWKAPVELEPDIEVLAALLPPRDFGADLKLLLSANNICSKRWVFEQYDSMVQTNTVQGPGGEAGVMRIKGTGGRRGLDPVAFAHSVTGKLAKLVAESTPRGDAALLAEEEDAAAGTRSLHEGAAGLMGSVERLVAESTPLGDAALLAGKEKSGRASLDAHLSAMKQREDGAPKGTRGERGLAMALAGNGRWTYLEPKLGAMHAVAEAARKVACTGAVPVAATNCLNFGNPEKPEIMAQLSEAIDGIAEACVALGTPVTGGNVSLYNETKGEGIYPTPVLGIVGIIEDVTKAVPAHFQAIGDKVLLLQSTEPLPALQEVEFGSSEYAKTIFGKVWGTPPYLDLGAESALHKTLALLSERGLIHSAKDISDGGLAVALAESGFKKDIGVHVTLGALSEHEYALALFGENATEVLVTCDFEDYGTICTLLDEAGAIWPLDLGETIADRVEIFAGEVPLVDEALQDLKTPWAGALESLLADEVLV